MKKITKLSYLLFISLAIVSCSKDDDDTPEIFTDTVEYNDVSFNVEQANIYDYGNYIEGYYNYEFELTGKASDNTPFEFYVDLYSKGTEAFKTGTFQYYGSENIQGAPDYWFSYGEIQVDNGTSVEAVSGTVVVTKNGDIYTLSGQITLENDKVVTISYSGAFTVTDESEN